MLSYQLKWNVRRRYGPDHWLIIPILKRKLPADAIHLSSSTCRSEIGSRCKGSVVGLKVELHLSPTPTVLHIKPSPPRPQVSTCADGLSDKKEKKEVVGRLDYRCTSVRIETGLPIHCYFWHPAFGDSACSWNRGTNVHLADSEPQRTFPE